ncbi:hypothetical protein [Noviherbaspirillum malthae]|nr:hypothetical protein [Noviherbaspirillum malthae]
MTGRSKSGLSAAAGRNKPGAAQSTVGYHPLVIHAGRTLRTGTFIKEKQ